MTKSEMAIAEPTDKEIVNVAVEKLHFDPENPRLPLKLRGSAESEVFAFLLRECSLVELMLSIGSQGFFNGEPLLVVPKGESGEFIVVEGNRRLAALKLLSRTDPPPVFIKQVTAARDAAKVKPEEVPVLRFNKRDDILVYLGYRHITGVNEWGALEKARYLAQLSRKFPEGPDKFKTLAKQIGSRADFVAQTLAALELVEMANDHGFFDKYKIDPDRISFSLLTTALSYKTIYEYIGLESREKIDQDLVSAERLDELFGWLFVEEQGKTRLGESRNLKALARVVASPSALRVFQKGRPLEEADLFTEGPLVLIRKMMLEAEARLSTALDTLKHAQGINVEDSERAQAIEKAARYLRSSIEIELAER